jgi:hypothetical protein
MEKARPRRMGLLRYIAVGGGLLSLVLIVLAVLVAFDRFRVGTHETDPGVALATTGLALFTGLLFFAAAVTAYFAYDEISTSTISNRLSADANEALADANKANLALQMDNRFNSDRALRIRHGSVTFLAKHQSDENGELRRDLDLDCRDFERLSPYATDKAHRWNDLPSDLIDLFNYFDWIGYLALEKPKTIDLDVVAQKFGPWIIEYYHICEKEIDQIRINYPARWRYLKRLYEKLVQKEEVDWNNNSTADSPSYREKDSPEEIAAFLFREHARSHRGATP